MTKRQEDNDAWVKELFLPALTTMTTALNNSNKAIEATAQVINENNTILTGIHQVFQTHILITEATNKILERLSKPSRK